MFVLRGGQEKNALRKNVLMIVPEEAFAITVYAIAALDLRGLIVASNQVRIVT